MCFRASAGIITLADPHLFVFSAAIRGGEVGERLSLASFGLLNPVFDLIEPKVLFPKLPEIS